jgi:hypothetical protein
MNESVPKANYYGVKNLQSEMQKKGHEIFHTLYKKEKFNLGLFQNPVHPLKEVGYTYTADQHFMWTYR